MLHKIWYFISSMTFLHSNIACTWGLGRCFPAPSLFLSILLVVQQQAHQHQLLCHQEDQRDDNFAPVGVPFLSSATELINPCLLDALLNGVEHTGIHSLYVLILIMWLRGARHNLLCLTQGGGTAMWSLPCLLSLYCAPLCEEIIWRITAGCLPHFLFCAWQVGDRVISGSNGILEG